MPKEKLNLAEEQLFISEHENPAVIRQKIQDLIDQEVENQNFDQVKIVGLEKLQFQTRVRKFKIKREDPEEKRVEDSKMIFLKRNS